MNSSVPSETDDRNHDLSHSGSNSHATDRHRALAPGGSPERVGLRAVSVILSLSCPRRIKPLMRPLPNRAKKRNGREILRGNRKTYLFSEFLSAIEEKVVEPRLHPPNQKF